MNMSLSTHNLRLLHDHLQGLISSHHMTWDWPQFLTWCVHNRVQDFNFRLGINIYRTRAIISRGLYIFYSIFHWFKWFSSFIAALVCPKSFFCKQLKSVINKYDQRTTKMAIKYFWPFGCFRIEGRKQKKSRVFKVDYFDILCQKIE